MPSIYHPTLVERVIQAQRETSRAREETRAQSFLTKIECQFNFFEKYSVPGFSLKGQIHKQLNNFFLKPTRPFEGIVCIGYTDVLVHAEQKNLNGAPIERWEYFLKELRKKGFLVVLISEGDPVLS